MYSDIDIKQFLDTWYEPFQIVHQGINLISGCTEEQLQSLHPGKVLTFDERVDLQKYWLRIRSQLRVEDQAFFQPHWVPVQADLCQWFIDLSDPKFPVFTGQFIELQPQNWYQNMIHESLSKLILDLEGGKSFDDLHEFKRSLEAKNILMGLKLHDELIYNGVVPISPVDLSEVFLDCQVVRPIAPEGEDAFIILNAMPLAIGLLDPDADISLNSIRWDDDLDITVEEFERITCIRQLMLLLRDEGQENFLEFQFDLIELDVMVWYNTKNEMIIMGLDGPGKKKMIDAINELSKNSPQNN
jgi:hypothetical protein